MRRLIGNPNTNSLQGILLDSLGPFLYPWPSDVSSHPFSEPPTTFLRKWVLCQILKTHHNWDFKKYIKYFLWFEQPLSTKYVSKIWMNYPVMRYYINRHISYFYMFVSTLINERSETELSRKVWRETKKWEFVPHS